MYKIGLSTCGGKPVTEQAFLEMKQSGIDAVELKDVMDYETVKKAADAVGIELWSVHTPAAYDIDISSTDSEINKNAIKVINEVVNKGAAVGIKNFVVHPTSTAEDLIIDRNEMLKHTMYCADLLAEYAAKKGVYIAIENLPRKCLCNTVAEHLQVLSANDKLRACLDLNHSLIDPTEKYIEDLGERLVTLHVSDRDNQNERHWLCGEGVLDWVGIINALQKANYKGVWMYEVDMAPRKTIDRRMLTYKDFYDNAKTIFEKRQPKPIGTPKKNLGMWGPIE